MREDSTARLADLVVPQTGNAGQRDRSKMLTIARCTVLAVGTDCTDMEELTSAELNSLRDFLVQGLCAPRRDAPDRLFWHRDPERFRDCFRCSMVRFVEACTRESTKQVVAQNGDDAVALRSCARIGSSRIACTGVSASP